MLYSSKKFVIALVHFIRLVMISALLCVGGLFLQNFRRVPNLWVLLHFCVTFSNVFPNFSGSQGGPDQDTSPKEGLSPLVLPQPNSTYERNSVNNIISHNDLLKLNVIKKLRLKILQKENTNWLPWTKELHHGYYWLYYSFLFFNIEFLTRQAKSRDMALAKTSICSSMKTKKNRET